MNFSKLLILIAALMIAAVPMISQSTAALRIPHRSYDLTLSDIQLRPGVTVTLNATVFVNDRRPCVGGTALAIHGMLHTAASWDRFSAALFDNRLAGRNICSVIALDMPGHGHSGVPQGMWFGDVGFQDYVTAVLDALDHLKTHRLHPDIIIGHSLGGFMTQLIQQRLISQSTDLRTAYGIKDVVLLASGTPKQVPSYAIDSGMLSQLIMRVAQVNPVAGTVGIPDAVWSWMLFTTDPTNPTLVVPGTPTPDEVASRGYNAPEPLSVVGAFADRPGVDAGLFAAAHGTALTLVTYQQDVVARPDESLVLYNYLTNSNVKSRFVLVPGPEAIHDTHISNPDLLLNSIGAVVRVPNICGNDARQFSEID